MLGPLGWPALTAEAFWRFGKLPYGLGGFDNDVSADGLTLRVALPAPPERLCPGQPVMRYDPVVTESATAVAVGIRMVPTGEVAPGEVGTIPCYETGSASYARHEVRLAAPLGDRVVVSAYGAGPVAVTPQR